jgi:hypothetical protein
MGLHRIADAREIHMVAVRFPRFGKAAQEKTYN